MPIRTGLFALLFLFGCSNESAEDAAPAATETKEAMAETLPRSMASADARLFFKSPTAGATVPATFTVEFGLTGMDVVPAGTDAPASGHHHLIINADLPAFDQPIPATENYRHFGDGSTSVELTLPPGQHSLQLLLGDHLHIPHEPPVYSDPITVTVEE